MERLWRHELMAAESPREVWICSTFLWMATGDISAGVLLRAHDLHRIQLKTELWGREMLFTHFTEVKHRQDSV